MCHRKGGWTGWMEAKLNYLVLHGIAGGESSLLEFSSIKPEFLMALTSYFGLVEVAWRGLGSIGSILGAIVGLLYIT